MTQYDINVNKAYFDAINNEISTFVIRKHKRKYRVGDTLKIYCVDNDGELVTVPNYKEGRSNVPLRVYACITYILTHNECSEGIPDGYVILGIRRTG